MKLGAGESEEINFEITPGMMKVVNQEGESVLEEGKCRIYIGGSSPSARNTELGASQFKQAEFTVQ